MSSQCHSDVRSGRLVGQVSHGLIDQRSGTTAVEADQLAENDRMELACRKRLPGHGRVGNVAHQGGAATTAFRS